MYYPGIIKLDPQIQEFLAWKMEAKTTKSSDHYFFVTPKYEVSSGRLKWMEQTMFVAQ